jgi:sensor domain CHASE-containing protein
MDILTFIWLVLPIVIGAGVIVLIVVVGQVIKARMTAIGKSSFEKLANELKEENAKIMTKLTEMEKNLNSIDKMMKDVG